MTINFGNFIALKYYLCGNKNNWEVKEDHVASVVTSQSAEARSTKGRRRAVGAHLGYLLVSLNYASWL